MTQSRTPAGSGAGTGTGAEQTGGASTTLNGPVALVWDEVAGRQNRLDNVDEIVFSLTGSSSGEVATYVAKDNGRVVGLTFANDDVIMAGTHGWRILVQDETQSDTELADFNIGSVVTAGNDTVATIAANAVAYVSNSLTGTANHFSKGDVITVDVTETATAGIADVIVHLSYEAQGYVA